jgi:hypothetical protein
MRDQDKRAVRLVNTHHLEADEAKHDGDVVEVLPRRASALIQQGYAGPAEGNERLSASRTARGTARVPLQRWRTGLALTGVATASPHRSGPCFLYVRRQGRAPRGMRNSSRCSSENFTATRTSPRLLGHFC